jgi:hypothetical protein
MDSSVFMFCCELGGSTSGAAGTILTAGGSTVLVHNVFFLLTRGGAIGVTLKHHQVALACYAYGW